MRAPLLTAAIPHRRSNKSDAARYEDISVASSHEDRSSLDMVLSFRKPSKKTLIKALSGSRRIGLESETRSSRAKMGRLRFSLERRGGSSSLQVKKKVEENSCISRDEGRKRGGTGGIALLDEEPARDSHSSYRH